MNAIPSIWLNICNRKKATQGISEQKWTADWNPYKSSLTLSNIDSSHPHMGLCFLWLFWLPTVKECAQCWTAQCCTFPRKKTASQLQPGLLQYHLTRDKRNYGGTRSTSLGLRFFKVPLKRYPGIPFLGGWKRKNSEIRLWISHGEIFSSIFTLGVLKKSIINTRRSKITKEK